jgi:hypothetical protein
MFSVEESLWPLIVWMKIFGFQMGPTKKPASNRQHQ